MPSHQLSRVAIVLGLLLAIVLALSAPLSAQNPTRLLPPPVHPSRLAQPELGGAILEATVIRVADGDSLKVRIHGESRTVRLACIDAPELDQPPWGSASRAWLQAHLPPGTSVRLVPKATDRYGRLVAELVTAAALSEVSINRMLVEDGQAFVYPRHVHQCDAARYREAQDRASAQRVGVWQEPGGIERPWAHRQRAREIRPHRPQPLPRPGLSWGAGQPARSQPPAAAPVLKTPAEPSSAPPASAPSAPPAAQTPAPAHRSAPAATLRPDRPRPPRPSSTGTSDATPLLSSPP